MGRHHRLRRTSGVQPPLAGEGNGAHEHLRVHRREALVEPALAELSSQVDLLLRGLRAHADFEYEFDRTPDNSRLFARLLSMIASREKLRPLDRAATARLIEACVREAGDAEKISASLMNATDLVRESDYHAARNGRHVIASDDVQEALDARTRRASRVRDRLQEEIGIEFLNEEAQVLFREAGCKVDGTNVKMGRDWVMEMVGKTPANIVAIPPLPYWRF